MGEHSLLQWKQAQISYANHSYYLAWEASCFECSLQHQAASNSLWKVLLKHNSFLFVSHCLTKAYFFKCCVKWFFNTNFMFFTNHCLPSFVCQSTNSYQNKNHTVKLLLCLGKVTGSFVFWYKQDILVFRQRKNTPPNKKHSSCIHCFSYTGRQKHLQIEIIASLTTFCFMDQRRHWFYFFSTQRRLLKVTKSFMHDHCC